MVEGRYRWLVVTLSVVASSLVGLPVGGAEAASSYEDVVGALEPLVYFRLAERSVPADGRLVDEMGSSVDSSWNGGDDVTFGVAGAVSGDDAIEVGYDGSGPAASPWFDVGSLQAAGSVTIAAWVDPSGLPPAGSEADILAVKGSYGGVLAGLRLGLTSSGTVVAEAGTDMPGSTSGPGDNPPGSDPAMRAVRAESVGTVTAQGWHQVVAVYDHASRSVWVSVDGVVRNGARRGFGGIGWNTLPNTQTWPYSIGGGHAPLSVRYEGGIDEVAAFGRAISLADIRSTFLASGRTAPPGWDVPDGASGTDLLGPNAARDWDELLRCHCADPVDTGTGNLHIPIAAVSVPGRGPGLEIEMGYNSLAAGVPSSIGYGWSTTLDMELVDDAFTGGKTVVQETGATVPFHKVSGGWSAPVGYTASLVAAPGGFVFTRNHTERFGFDSSGRLTSIGDRYANTTTVSYPTNDPASSAFRHASAMTDGAGRSLVLAWWPATAPRVGARGRLASISEPAVTGQGARTATFDYDASGYGNLEVYTDVSGGKTVFTYDDAEFDPVNHLLTKLRKPRHFGDTSNSKVVENNFDAKGRVQWQEDELNRRTDFAYDTPSVGRTTVTMPAFDDAGDRHVRIDTYLDGIRTRTVTAAGTAAQQTTDFEFWPGTNAPKTITDNAGKSTAFTADSEGNLLSQTDPTGRTTRWTYGIFDQVTSATTGERNGNTSEVVTTVNEYDTTNGRLEKTTVASGTADAAVTDYVYGDASHPEDVTKVVDARSKEWTSGYSSGTGYLEWSENPEHERTTYTSNEIGWPKTVTSPKGTATASPTTDFQTSYSYDLAARSTTVTGPTGDKTKTVFDADGNTVSVATGPTLADVTSYSYTDAGELTVEDPPGAGSRSYGYFANGAQKSFTNELGATTSYTYDAAGNVVSATDPAERVTTYSYDAVGRVQTVRQPVTGATCTAATKVGCIRYFYDDAGRVTGIDYSDPNTADLVDGTDFANGVHYDNLGRRDGVHARTGTGASPAAVWDETWSWTKRSQIASHTDRNGDATATTYNPDGTIATITYPGNKTVTRGYDDAGRFTSSTDWASRTATFGYDDDSNWTTTAFATANTDVFGYDPAGRMTSATWRQGSATGTVLGSETYTRPVSTKGMVDMLTPAGAAGMVVRDYGYDGRDRLTGTGPGGESFSLDAGSNLLRGPGGMAQGFNRAQELCWASVSGTGSASTSVACPAAPADATVYGSDSLGRRSTVVTQDEDRRTHSYDQADRLVRVVDDNTGTNDPTTAMSDRPVVGDFDGDGQDDVMAYRPGGSNDDPVWWGADRDVFGTSTDTFSVLGDYTALSGDFDGDGFSDILWYKPGTGADSLWFWFGRTDGAHSSRAATIDTTDYTPFTGDFDGDGRTDVYWYRAGTGTDVIWWGDPGADQDNHLYAKDGLNVSGSYRPVTGDFDGDGRDEIFWYGPGSRACQVLCVRTHG